MAYAANSTMTMLPPPDENRGPAVLAVTWVETVVALVFVVGRMYCRGVLLRNLGRDDWTMLLAFITSCAASVMATLAVHFGVGRHIMYLEPDAIETASKFFYMNEPFNTFGAGFAKISIAFLLLRIMNRNKPQEIILWTIIISLIVVNIACLVFTFVGCTPVYMLWHGPQPSPNCWDPRIKEYVGTAQSAYSSATDLILAVFPYFIIRTLKMDRRIKIGLICLLSLGIFATVASIVKTVALRNLTLGDFTWYACDLAYWIPTENYVIIIAACVPTLRPLFIQKPQLQTTQSSKSRSAVSRGMGGQFSGNKYSMNRSGLSHVRSIDEIPLTNGRPTMVTMDEKYAEDVNVYSRMV